VIERYSPQDMAALFSTSSTLHRWLHVELLAVEGWASIGAIPREDSDFLWMHAPGLQSDFVQRVADREAEINHDVAAFVDVLEAWYGDNPAARWVHYGLTSSDVVDTALSWALHAAGKLIHDAARELMIALTFTANEFKDLRSAGRTHGQYAEPVSFGNKFALWALAVNRDGDRLRSAIRRMRVGKLSGAVGTYSTIPPEVEAYVCNKIGLTPAPATQVLARDRHAEFVYACASLGATMETIAMEIRHLARSEVGEVSEGFGEDQKGSSAMPHKRNPIAAERICGIARMLRSYVVPMLENVALWHERDISHSSVERVILPDVCNLALFALRDTTQLISNLVVHRDVVERHAEDVPRSQHLMLQLIAAGMRRDDAYRLVQRGAPEDIRMALGGPEQAQDDATWLDLATRAFRKLA